jgi:dihydroneopterin aldolase
MKPGNDHGQAAVEIELRGLSVYTHHGVDDAEQRVGQRLLIDVLLEPADCGALRSDRIEETIDYSAVADLIAETATERSYRTLERLCAVVAERLIERFGARRASVRAAKPEPPIAHAIDLVAVEVTRSADGS